MKCSHHPEVGLPQREEYFFILNALDIIFWGIEVVNGLPVQVLKNQTYMHYLL